MIILLSKLESICTNVVKCDIVRVLLILIDRSVLISVSSSPRKGSSKVTDRKLVNNVVHYKLAGDKKNGGGWKAVFGKFEF